MSFWDHLEALRGTLFRSVLAVAVCTGVFLAIPKALFRAVLWPTRPDFPLYGLPGIDFSLDLVNIEITAQFFVYLKVALLCGVVVAFPFIVWQLWLFIAPALYPNEKKAVRGAFSLSSFLFYLGVAVGYFVVLPVCLIFFGNFSVSDAVKNTVSLSSYISLFTSMVFLIGLLFEFPTVVIALSALGIVNRGMLRKGRRYAFVLVLVLAAFITPSDPFSMFVLGIPLYGLYELSIFLSKEAPASDDINQ